MRAGSGGSEWAQRSLRVMHARALERSGRGVVAGRVGRDKKLSFPVIKEMEGIIYNSSLKLFVCFRLDGGVFVLLYGRSSCQTISKKRM